MSSELWYVQSLQQVYDNYYETHTQDVMVKLEQEATKIQDIIYDSRTKHDFDRVSGAVDRDANQVGTNSIKLTYNKDNHTNTNSTKYDHNTKTEDQDIETQNDIQDGRHDNKLSCA